MERMINAKIVEAKLAKLEEVNEYWHDKAIELANKNRELVEINDKLVKINFELIEMNDLLISMLG